jgi:hypothetical protein
MSGLHADQQQYWRPVGHPGYPKSSRTLARPIQAAAENPWPAIPGIRRCRSSASNTGWYYLRRPRIHMGWIHPIITHHKKRRTEEVCLNSAKNTFLASEKIKRWAIFQEDRHSGKIVLQESMTFTIFCGHFFIDIQLQITYAFFTRKQVLINIIAIDELRKPSPVLAFRPLKITGFPGHTCRAGISQCNRNIPIKT